MDRPSHPRDRDVLDARARQAAIEHHGPQPGRVQSYNPATQTADVVPLLRSQAPQPDGTTALEALPVIPSVPVVFLRVGGWGMSLKVAEGDTGLLVPCDGAIGHWRVGQGDVTDPGDLRRHHVAHSVFVPGLFVRSRALAHAASGDDAMVIGSDASDGTRVTFRVDGSVRITQGSEVVAQIDADGTVHLGGAVGELVALANLVDNRLTKLQSAFDAHVHATAATGPPSPPTAVPGVIPVGTLDSVAATKVKAT